MDSRLPLSPDESRDATNSSLPEPEINDPPVPQIDDKLPLKISIRKVLIANRGEIAVRIVSTLKRMRIHCVAIYTSADKHSPHVKAADSSVYLNGTTIYQTYLCSQAIIKAAKDVQADAVIPGYGLLAENADFAEACEKAGLVWIGPSPQHIRRLGRKDLARRECDEFFPLVNGSNTLEGLSHAFSEAGRVGYPVLVKLAAVSELGSFGMSKCESAEQLTATCNNMSTRGGTNFKDERILLEHLMDDVQHIEVQIIGDGRGNARHYGMRDCSLQRRNQKVIEESPPLFIEDAVCIQMCSSAVKMAKSLKYRSVGTVEFLYEPTNERFHFFDIKTRIPIEHAVTEAVCDIDLVEDMIDIASNDALDLFPPSVSEFDCISYDGHAIEVRIYAENPTKAFIASTGQILFVSFPVGVRVDTWIKAGTQITTTNFDRLLAKLVVHGSDREDALKRLTSALDNTHIFGVETNLEYLRQISKSSMFHRGSYRTTSLDRFEFKPAAIQVLNAGLLTTIQDYPGRQGFWQAGIPVSGPMDNFSFRMANKILKNDPDAAGLECTALGPTLLFHCSTIVVVVGAATHVKLGIDAVRMSFPILVRAGQTLSVGSLSRGHRCYIAFKGGLNVPKVFGSRSTFTLGALGGCTGQALKVNDMISIPEFGPLDLPLYAFPFPLPMIDQNWTLRVMTGPHAYPEYFTETDYAELFSQRWTVHYNSSRIGVKLTGPKPKWARVHGGEAGLHPSNIHESAYSIGSISFTGDEAVILTCDGPTLGGFMVFATVVSAELWKVGQMKPGDTVSLCPVAVESAMILSQALCLAIEDKSALPTISFAPEITNPILGSVQSLGRKVTCRQSGDTALLLEFEPDGFDLRTTFHIQYLLQQHNQTPIPGVQELTRGVRSIHIRYDPAISRSIIIDSLTAVLADPRPIPTISSSRTIYLPLTVDDPSTFVSISRYIATIRKTAPWLPDNIGFLQQVNNLGSRSAVATTIFASSFLVLGLGDVFLGSPCAVPLDPRNRLFGTKYNPPRSYTPEGTVGIGGQYMCIYGIQSPGGNQLIGRTVPIWDGWADEDVPWLLRPLDVVKFYPIGAEVLDDARFSRTWRSLIKIDEGLLDLVAYERWVEEVGPVAQSATERLEFLKREGLFEALTRPYDTGIVEGAGDAGQLCANFGTIEVRAGLPGRVWKWYVKEGDTVRPGQALICIESMKMLYKISAPAHGRLLRLCILERELVGVGTRVAFLLKL